ncbi:MAG: hypothetical protein OJF50_005910 [Nitrospira sp.]|nr:hypothetical protein [Nitrospira sp.]
MSLSLCLSYISALDVTESVTIVGGGEGRKTQALDRIYA